MSTTKFMNAEEAVQYAVNASFKSPLGKSFAIQKSYVRPDGTLAIEGWISTPKKDIERDILEPESFAGPGLHEYMQRGAPISVEHNTRTFPVGYLQKARLVRDGEVIQDEVNPKQPAEDFRYYREEVEAQKGTGWYALGSIYSENAKIGIQKGVVSSFSWLGMPVEWEPMADGGKHFVSKGSVNPILEVTITAYPVNTAATLRIAKSRGYVPHLDRKRLVELLGNPLVVEAVVGILVPPGTSSAVVEEQLRQYRYGTKGKL
jgi:hypothetical protein